MERNKKRSSKKRRIENEETEAASSEEASSAAASSSAASSEEVFQPSVSHFNLSMPPYTNQYSMEERNSRYKEFFKNYTGFNSGANLGNLSSEQELLIAWAHIQDRVIRFIKDWVNKKLKNSEESDDPETRDVNDINKFFIKKTYELLKEKIDDDFLYNYFKFGDLRRELKNVINYIARYKTLPILDMENLKAYFPAVDSDDYKKLYSTYSAFIYDFECIKLPRFWEHDFEVPMNIIPNVPVSLMLLPIDVAETENPLKNIFYRVDIKQEEAVGGKIITRRFHYPIDELFQSSLVHKSNIPNTPEHRHNFKEHYEKLNKEYDLDKLNVFKKELLFLRRTAKKTKIDYGDYIAYVHVIVFLKDELKECDEKRKRIEYYDEMIEKMRLEHERKTSTLKASKKSKKPKKKKKKPKKSKKPKKTTKSKK